MCTLLAAILVCPSWGIAASGPSDTVHRVVETLRRQARAIRSQSVVQDTVTTELRGGVVVSEQHDTANLLFRADLGRIVLDAEAPAIPAVGDGKMPSPPDHSCRSRQVIQQSSAFPEWLRKFSDTLSSARCQVSASAEGRVVSVLGNSPLRGQETVAAQITLDRHDLPVRLVTLGSHQEVLDEILVKWKRHSVGWVLEGVTYVHHSVLNVVRREVTYRDLRINAPLASSLFEP